MEIHFLRLHPGEDIKKCLDLWAAQHAIHAATVISGIGSLSVSCIRYAGRDTSESVEASWEILTLQGTLSVHGSHLHMSISDGKGNVRGGHVKEGNIIRTTAEVVVATAPGWQLFRRHDEATGYPELFPMQDP